MSGNRLASSSIVAGRDVGRRSDFRSIENVPGAGVLARRAPLMTVKEFQARLLGYNLVRPLAREAAPAHGREPREISLRHAL